MNSKLDDYLSQVLATNAQALETGEVSLGSSIPCYVCRELEAPLNRFVDSSDPFITSYRALSRNQHLARTSIPRKIEFESAVYLREGIIDRIFPNSPVTLLFIGDGMSDKRFSYNCNRLFRTFGGRYRIYSFICNADLIGTPFGRCSSATAGWDDVDPEKRLFFHATDWDELPTFLELAHSELRTHQVLVVIDFDGTYLSPRPYHNQQIKEARRAAIVTLSAEMFDNAIFDQHEASHVERLRSAYRDASETGFSKNYDDEDLTMLIALGLYAEIIQADDSLLNPGNDVGFSVPIEWLQYASFLIDNNAQWEHSLRQLRSLYTKCADALKAGSPTAFADFRRMEERTLVQADREDVVLNRSITGFLRECASLGCVPIGFSDRPNASLGLSSTLSPAYTAEAVPEALINLPLALTGED